MQKKEVDMKQNYLFLIIIISACHSLFSMEDFGKNAQDILDNSNKAKQAETSKNIPEALKLYTKVINTKLPAIDPMLGDPYPAARISQQVAANRIKVLINHLIISFVLPLLLRKTEIIKNQILAILNKHSGSSHRKKIR